MFLCICLCLRSCCVCVVSVSVLVCTYVCLYVFTCACLCFCVLLCAYVCLFLLRCAWLCLCMLIYACVCLCVLVCAYASLCALVFIYHVLFKAFCYGTCILIDDRCSKGLSFISACNLCLQSTQPTGLILKMLQDQQNNISQLTKTIEDLSTKLSEQMRINEKLNKLLQDERENNKIQKSTATNINKISKDISKTCILFCFFTNCWNNYYLSLQSLLMFFFRCK